MELNDFIEKFAEQFEETEKTVFNPHTRFKELDEWTSLTALSIIAMIDEHEITKKAYDQKAQIIETANEMSREITKGTKDYADGILEDLEKAINNVNGAINEALKTIEQNRSELK